MKLAGAVLLVAVLAASAAVAQEFAVPAASLSLGAGALLEHGLPDGRPGGVAAALDTQWPLAFSGRSLILGGAWRGVAASAGVASAGDDAFGWNAAALAVGVADSDSAGGAGAGAGVRVVVRREWPPLDGAPEIGIEAGPGGWVDLGIARVWASAPQAWLSGLAPPLPRGLVLGLEARAAGLGAGIEREAPRRGIAEPAGYSARIALIWSAAKAWVEARQDPWRGGLGVSGSIGAIEVAAQVDGHPVLPPIARMSVGLRLGAPNR